VIHYSELKHMIYHSITHIPNKGVSFTPEKPVNQGTHCVEEVESSMAQSEMFEKAEEMATVNGTPGTDEVLACVRLLSSVLVVHEVVHNLVKTKTSSSTYFTHYFKLIYLKSIAKQVIPTYINHSRPLIPDGIHLFF